MTLVRKGGLSDVVRLIEKCSHQAIPALEQEGVRAQLVFIDGSHLFDYVMADFLCSDRILDVGGMMAFDDSDWPAISQVLRFITANRHYTVPLPDIVIEGHPHHPTFAGRCLRWLGKRIPSLGAKLRPDYMVTNFELGIRGRCVVLRKMADDDRDSQSRFHHAF